MTSTPRALLTMGPESRLVTALLPGLQDRRMFFSFGDEIPDLTGFDTSYWSAGIWAARLQRLGLATDVCSPGSAWLPEIDPELVGREVQGGLLANFEARVAADRQVWVKPAESKIPAFKAGLYTPQQVAELLAAENINSNVELQWTESVLELDFEHRFFIQDGAVVAGSPYRMGANLGYGPGIPWNHLDEAERFANHALRTLAADDMLPPHFTLDVGFDMLRGRWLIVEGNRSWSSGVYGCDPIAVLGAVDAATHYAEERWRWLPDAEVAKRAAEMPLLTVLPIDSGSIGFAEYQG